MSATHYEKQNGTLSISETEMDFTDTDLLEELAARADILPQREPGEGVTARELAERLGCDYNKAKQLLDARAKAGELRAVQRINNGKKCTVYVKFTDM